MGYFVGAILIAFGIHTVSSDVSMVQGWVALIIGIIVLAKAINRPKSDESKGRGDGYRSSTADYTSGGDSGGGD